MRSTNPERTVESLLKLGVFGVPDNQRKFVWQQEQATELFDDLFDVMGKRGQGVFLGTIITLTEGNEDFEDEFRFYQIVDGQQRITSISLLLIALRQRAYQLDEASLIAGDLHQLIMITDTNSQDVKPILRVSKFLQPIFDQAVSQNWHGSFENRTSEDGRTWNSRVNHFNNAYQTFWEKVKNFEIDEVRNLMSALRSAEFVHINLTTFQEAIDLFERTNARGVQLGAGDLVKNFLFKRDRAGFQEIWTEIEESAQRAGVVKCLRYFEISKHGMVSKKDLYRKARISVGDTKESAETWVLELRYFANFFAHMTDPELTNFMPFLRERALNLQQRDPQNIRALSYYLQALKLMKVTQIIPMVYSAIMACESAESGDKKKKKVNDLKELLELLFRFHFRYTAICNKPGNKVEQLYARCASNICRTNSIKETTNELKTSFGSLDFQISFEDFERFFCEIEYNERSWESKAKIRLIFDELVNFGTGEHRYNLFLSTDDAADKNTFNVEHVYPQKIENDYASILEDNSYLHNIGNLFVLSTSENGEIGNWTPEKKIQYFKADKSPPKHISFFLESLETLSGAWDKEFIDRRAKELSRLCFEKIFALR
jgi:hypothetical protein